MDANAAPGKQRQRSAGAKGLVVGVGEDGQQCGRISNHSLSSLRNLHCQQAHPLNSNNAANDVGQYNNHRASLQPGLLVRHIKLTAACHHQVQDPRAHDAWANNLARLKTQEQRHQTLRLMEDNGLYFIRRKLLHGLDINHLNGH
jgi:hypothetical protein